MPNFNKITYKNYVPIYILSRPKMEASRYILCVPRVGGGGQGYISYIFPKHDFQARLFNISHAERLRLFSSWYNQKILSIHMF